jgi:hypothetical protein
MNPTAKQLQYIHDLRQNLAHLELPSRFLARPKDRREAADLIERLKRLHQLVKLRLKLTGVSIPPALLFFPKSLNHADHMIAELRLLGIRAGKINGPIGRLNSKSARVEKLTSPRLRTPPKGAEEARPSGFRR